MNKCYESIYALDCDCSLVCIYVYVNFFLKLLTLMFYSCVWDASVNWYIHTDIHTYRERDACALCIGHLGFVVASSVADALLCNPLVACIKKDFCCVLYTSKRKLVGTSLG